MIPIILIFISIVNSCSFGGKFRNHANKSDELKIIFYLRCCMMWWPCGQSYFGATFNSLIHVFMYAYYALSGKFHVLI